MGSLLISHDFLPGLSGGISVLYHNLCIRLSSEIQVLAPKCGEWQAFDHQQNYKIHRQVVPLVSPSFMRGIKLQIWHILYFACIALAQFVLYTVRACWLVIHEKIDVVLIGHLYLAPLGRLIQVVTGRPFAVILHGSELHRYWRFKLIRQCFIALLERASFLVVNSEATRRQYLDRGVKASSFVHIHPGVDVERFQPDANKALIVHRHKLADRSIVLTVARLVEWKGQDVMIRAMAHVVRTVPSAIYVMVGEGPHHQALKQLAVDLNLGDYVVFAGFVPDEELRMYYSAADVMVLVSREAQPGMPIEGFGIVYLEAGAAGLPVIGGRMGGAVEAVEDGVTGLLVDPHNEHEITDAIIRLLKDPELARQMGQRGRERAVREFTWEAQAEKLRRHLAVLVGDGEPV